MCCEIAKWQDEQACAGIHEAQPLIRRDEARGREPWMDSKREEAKQSKRARVETRHGAAEI